VAFDLTIAPVSTSATFRTNTTITLGAAPAEGSIVVIMLAHENKAGITASMPAGYTAHPASPISHSVADFKCYVAWKIAGAGESASATWTHGNAFTQGAIFNITGNATSFVIEGTSTSAQATNGTSFSFPSITTISDNAALVAVGFSTTESTNNTDTWTSPLTERADTTLIDIGAGTQAVAGASGAKSANTSIANLVSFMMAIAPESGPPPQLLQPDSTESAGAWTTDTGGTTNLHLAVDEAQPGSDTDYIQSALVPDGTSPVELGLPTPATPDTGVSRLRWRRRASAAYGDRIPTLDVALYRGATLVESFTDPLVPTLASSWSTAEIALTNTPAGWDDLRIRATAFQAPAAPPIVVGVGTASFTATNGATLSPALPTGWTVNDIHIAVVHRSDNTAISTPAGWTKWSPGGVAENNTTAQTVALFWRRAQAGDAAPSITAGTSTVVRGAYIIGVRGCPLTGDPLHLALRENKAASATVSNAGVTTTVANTRALFIYAYEDDPSAASTPSGWAAITPQVSALGNDMALGFSHKAMASTGATGAVSTTVSGGTFANSPHVTFTLTLLPAPGADARVQISWFELQVPAGTTTSHDLAATGSLAASLTAAATRDHPLAATGSAAASVTAVAGVAHPLTATGSAASSLTAVSTRAHPLTATGSAAVSLLAAGTRAHPLSATGSAATSITGTAAAVHPLSATGSLAASLTGLAGPAHPLTATGSLAGSLAGAAVGAHPLEATGSVAASVVSGALIAAHPLSATGSLAVELAASIMPGHQLTATGSVAAAITAAARVAHPLTATGSVAASLTGSAAKALPLTATGSVAASLTATSRAAHPLEATGSLAASTTAASRAAHPLSATGSAAASVTGLAAKALPLTATGSASATLTGNAFAITPGAHPLEATGSVAASTMATATIAHPLAATGSIEGTAVGAAVVAHPLSATGAVEAAVAAVVRAAHPLSATGSVAASLTGTATISGRLVNPLPLVIIAAREPYTISASRDLVAIAAARPTATIDAGWGS
jgi:hypothetical protein